MGSVEGTVCGAQLMLGQLDQAVASCENASGFSNSWYVRLMLTAAYANRGDMDKAAAAKAEVRRTVPGVTIAELKAKDPASAEGKALAERHFYAGLRKAGIPER